MKRALVFPGQGSQVVGMGKTLCAAFPVAREVFAEANEALGRNLTEIMFNGPENELVLSQNAQPALLTCSMAIFRVIERELKDNSFLKKITLMAGHSLGEYSALCASGVFTFLDSVKLVELRGKGMQQAVPVGDGSMAAILGLNTEDIKKIVREASKIDVCDFANDNVEGQSVISGSISGVEKGIELAKSMGAKRAIMLPVSAPFHSKLMKPAAEIMENALAKVAMMEPQVPVVNNINANVESSIKNIKQNLVDQVCGRVRWRESIVFMTEQRIGEIIELGCGRVLSGMIRRIDNSMSTKNIAEPSDIELLLKDLQ